MADDGGLARALDGQQHGLLAGAEGAPVDVFAVQTSGQGLRPTLDDPRAQPGLLDDPDRRQARLAALTRQAPQEIVRAHEEATHPSPKYEPWCGPHKAILGRGWRETHVCGGALHAPATPRR